MKPQTKEPSVQLKTKRISAVLYRPIFAGLIACLVFNVQAAVQVTRFDPPLKISAYADVPEPLLFNVLAADLDSDGNIDFRLASGLVGMEAYFNAPVRFAQRVSGPGVVGRDGPVGAVPLNSFIGTNIVSFVTTNYFAWASGETNIYDLTQPFGDHQTTVILANIVPANVPFGEFSNGILVTNVNFPVQPIVSGDVVGKEGVMALEFYVNGQVHYGYIHFDFTDGASGVIYGWAYETEPNLPIAAQSLALKNHIVPPVSEARSGIIGFVREGNLPGWIITISSHGAGVTNLQADDAGLFKADLPAGSYVLTPFHGPPMVPGQPVSNSSEIGRSRQVTVLRNHFRFIEMTP